MYTRGEGLLRGEGIVEGEGLLRGGLLRWGRGGGEGIM